MENTTTNILLILLIIFSPILAFAETVIIEYSDHYYVESTGPSTGKPMASRESVVPPSRPPLVPFRESIESPATPMAAAERQKALASVLAQLQREHNDLVTPREGDTPDQINRKQQEAYGKLMKIKRMSSELQKLTDQNKEPGK